MRLYEDIHTEFKSIYTDDIKKTVVAFANTVNASEAAILKMIRESDGEGFESARSLNQSLTFLSAGQEFQKRGIPLEEAQQRSLHLMTAEGLYTNLALLLSDQCPFTIKAARFSGTDKYTFQDRAEFSGSLFAQLEQAYSYLERHNQLGSRFSGLHRIDRRDYPDEALREALLNAAIHRDYSYRSSILISIFDDRMEIVSMGGLMPGLTQDDIMMGISLQRNENLASIFYRLQLVEAFGTGLPRINLAYKKTPQKPEIQVSENAFKIVLPNQNAGYTVTKQDYLELREPEASYRTAPPSQLHHQLIQEYLAGHDTITRPQAEKLLSVSQATAARILARMTREGSLQRLGQGRDTCYRLTQ